MLLTTVMVIFRYYPLALTGSWSDLSKPPPAEPDAVIPLSAIIHLVETSIQDSIDSLDVVEAKSELGFDLGANFTRRSYEDHLREYWAEFFTPLEQEGGESGRLLDEGAQADIEVIVEKLGLLPNSRHVGEDASRSMRIPQNIYTTSLEDDPMVPEQFRTWATENSDWTTRYVSDVRIDEWVTKVLRNTGVERELNWLKGHWGVVRSDLFRYLILLLEGGVYTDTDTACVRPISKWADGAVEYKSSIPLLDSLPQLLSLTNTTNTARAKTFTQSEEEGQEESSHQATEAWKEDERRTEPTFIVALESDSLSSGHDWREKNFVRGMQVVQWTILAQMGHPILLDTLGHALRAAKSVRERTEDGEEVEVDILNLSGPGVFTDAVFRYLLVRYGVHPKQVSGINHPLRIGDVLIMPVHSFRADASEGYQGEHRVVWHGFFGRWKEDEK